MKMLCFRQHMQTELGKEGKKERSSENWEKKKGKRMMIKIRGVVAEVTAEKDPALDQKVDRDVEGLGQGQGIGMVNPFLLANYFWKNHVGKWFLKAATINVICYT